MSNNVFANDREVSCKSGAGKSIASFPDVCFTPPENPATPPGVPIPYPNTGMASDTTSGSKTVKITNKEVMLKNKSYFKKSMGDEAGCAAKKGVVTSVHRGKVYFTSWSMDVKIEGENAVRHLDLTTHNHNSPPGNTPPWVYADTPAAKSACADERKEAKKKCAPSAKDKKEFKKDQDRANDRRKKKGKRRKAVREMGWKDKHCTGLMRVKPYTDIKNAKKALEDTVENVQNSIDNLQDALVDKGIEIASDKAKKVAARAGAKYAGSLLGGPLAPLFGAISTAVTVVDGAYSTVSGAMEAYDVYKDVQDKIGPMEDIMSQAQAKMSEAKEGMDLLDKYDKGNLTDAEAKRLDELKRKAADSGRQMANAQALQAMKDPCLRALKCNLTPYNQKQGMAAQGNKPQQQGCCPGQTGHHIPPKSYFASCPSYKASTALVVCAEGVDQRSGSHGKLHDKQDKAAQRLSKGGDLSFDDAIDAAVDSHAKSFPASGCSKKCIREQLEKSLKKCEASPINAVNKEGGKIADAPKDDANF